jgi:CheY-like chemotaxis protein
VEPCGSEPGRAVARILVIEDDENVRTVVCRALQRVGHVVFVGIDGRDGLDQFVHHQLDLVITDLVMPVQEGIETIQRIKQLEPDLPIIAMSGVMREGEFSILDDALLMGANLALQKPFDVTALIATVDRALAMRGTQDEQVEGSA